MIVKVYWWQGTDNFGDWITPYLLNKFEIKYEYASYDKADLISVGSIIGGVFSFRYLFSRLRKIVVLGSGLMKNFEPTISFYLKAKLIDIRLVRGPLTKNLIDKFFKNEIPFGDPGLISSYFFDKTKIKNNYKIGIIPHHSFYNEFSNITLPQGWVLIDPRTRDCESIFKSICECQLVISQSLHGLVVSDSFAIPNIWLKYHEVHEGDDFKFQDYFLSIERSESLCLEVSDLKKLKDFSTIDYENFIFQINLDILSNIKEKIIDAFIKYRQSL